MAAELDGPRLEPRSGAARKLVVFLHGYGADGKDLIEIGRAWQQYLPDAAFVSPHAPEPCAGAPMGRQWFPLTFREPHPRSTASSTPSSRAASFPPRRWRWSASARAP
jgi:phospholipase/carboxylesterase